MKIKLENVFGITQDQINIPLIIENIPMGTVIDATSEEVTVLLWDRFITVDKELSLNNEENKITAIQIKHKLSAMEQLNSFVINNNDIE